MIAVDAVIVTAMADEAAPFVDRADFVGPATRVGHAEHRMATLAGRQVLLVTCGIGLVNSATAAAVAINATHPRALVSAGSAGGVGVDVRVGDVVVGSEYLYSGADARAFGYSLGQVPGMPEVYAAEKALHDAAATASVDLTVLSGTVLSGDAFIDATRVDRIRAAFPGALATDMESAALAHTSHLYGVPFLSVRGISDLCGPVAGEDFLAHVDDAADRSAAVVVEVLRSLQDA
ncbi:5'-methylthioadenosine/adenosylhomocysteine nucleosidase [Cellulomonas sp.]|uniref:5'-methylthioadenosine/adenosylhomocysteine nucleosidase n=1 Tax=Cellulomonas sp. TaxID=40001 RepID=UPI001B164885|nr:5'-methylthioadenosine/adenosylhomocysteine nucleosidase [Cellulomonas sp.]MBO9554742.1 5'-methylthioadenosine/adenosylhomocysteine nucleosidase [Cellulomonas sp.]